ncbi:hypothetical protein D3C78_1922750 [compost metagenome]
MHALLYLRCARTTVLEAVQYASKEGRDFVWSTQHSVEMAMALLDALLDGIEAQQMRA